MEEVRGEKEDVNNEGLKSDEAQPDEVRYEEVMEDALNEGTNEVRNDDQGAKGLDPGGEDGNNEGVRSD